MLFDWDPHLLFGTSEYKEGDQASTLVQVEERKNSLSRIVSKIFHITIWKHMKTRYPRYNHVTGFQETSISISPIQFSYLERNNDCRYRKFGL